MIRTMLAGAALLLCGTAFWPGVACAHAPGFSRSDWQPAERGVQAHIGLSPTELLLLVPATDHDGDGAVASAEVQAASPQLWSALAAGLRVSVRDQPCRLQPGPGEVTLVDPTSVEAVLRYACPTARALTVDLSPLLDRLSVGHQHLLAAPAADGTVVEHLLDAEHPELDLGSVPVAAAQPWFQVWRLGAEHILGGLDHLAFLLGLLLAGAGWRALLWLLTAFTLAHSLTLALMISGAVLAPPTLVEPLIALSVALVAAANLRRPGTSEALRGWRWHGRWLLVFAFGLIHGFGFAGAVAGLTPDPARMWPWLLAFNLGIESGQLLVAVVGLVVLWRLARRPAWQRGVTLAANSVLLLAGLGWMVARISG